MLNSLKRIFILTLLCLYTVFKAIQIWPTPIGWVSGLTLLFFFVMTGWLFIYHAKPFLVNKLWFRLVAWIGSFAMGLWATFILLSIPLDLGFLGYYLFCKLTHLVSYHAEKISHLARQVNFIVLVISAVIALLGFIEVLRGPKVKQISLSIPNLPAALNHFKIAQLSDLHIGPTIRKNYIDKVVQLTNAATPDIIVITGDIADAKAESIAPALDALANLKAPDGIFYVTGNHEYYWDAPGLIAKMKSIGAVVLVNENRVLDINGAKILVAGVPDVIGGNFLKDHHPDVQLAIKSPQQTDFKILLSHRPEICFEAEKIGFDLQFSGHTHGGQFFPFNVLVAWAHEYYRQLNKLGRLWLHVNPGTGYWGPANRFGIPAEITLLTLQI